MDATAHATASVQTCRKYPGICCRISLLHASTRCDSNLKLRRSIAGLGSMCVCSMWKRWKKNTPLFIENEYKRVLAKKVDFSAGKEDGNICSCCCLLFRLMQSCILQTLKAINPPRTSHILPPASSSSQFTQKMEEYLISLFFLQIPSLCSFIYSIKVFTFSQSRSNSFK